jgi:hypothetical protein
VGTLAASFVSGFLAYLVGGYVAAKLAGCSGGRHGILTDLLSFNLFGGYVGSRLRQPPSA